MNNTRKHWNAELKRLCGEYFYVYPDDNERADKVVAALMQRSVKDASEIDIAWIHQEALKKCKWRVRKPNLHNLEERADAEQKLITACRELDGKSTYRELIKRTGCGAKTIAKFFKRHPELRFTHFTLASPSLHPNSHFASPSLHPNDFPCTPYSTSTDLSNSTSTRTKGEAVVKPDDNSFDIFYQNNQHLTMAKAFGEWQKIKLQR